MPPDLRNHLEPTGGDTPASRAASSLERPVAIAAQNRTSSSRRAESGRPGECNLFRPDRSDRRLRTVIATSYARVLRRPIELAQSTSIGFGAEVRGPDDRNTGDILKNVEPEDLRRFGMIPELVGRLPVIATLTELDVAALVTILTEPRNALIRQFQHLFEMEGVRLEFSDGALKMIAETAIGRRIGARGLRSIVEGVLLETMFELPDLDGLEEVAIDRKTVQRRRKPRYSYADRRQDPGSNVPRRRRSRSE